LQWVVSAYALTFAGLLLLGGRAADLLGRRRMFMIGLGVFTLASLLCGLAWSSEALIGARALQGVGAAIMTPTALSIITTTFREGSERNKALGIWGSLGGVGGTAAWLIGGPLVDGPGWSWIFFINVPIGVGAMLLVPRLIRESRDTAARRSFDPAGALTVSGALFLLVYALVDAPQAGWSSARTILLFAGAAALLGIFTAVESRHRAPLLPLRILRSRTLVGANLAMLLFSAAAFGMPFVLTLYAQDVLGFSAMKFGATSVVFPVTAAIGAIVGQAIVLRVGFRPVASIGMALLIGGCVLLTQVSVDGSYFGDLFPALVVFGPGVGLTFVTMTIAALAGVHEREAGLASGLSNTAFQIGAALGTAIVSTVFVSRSAEFMTANPDADPLLGLTEGFQAGFAAAIVFPVLGLLVSLLLLGRPRRPAEQPFEAVPAAARD
jgi:EmrB/QacA subfamily drug resistance transporter